MGNRDSVAGDASLREAHIVSMCNVLEMLETGNGTVTPVVSNLRIYPALVDGYLPFAHFFPSFFIPYALPTR